MGACSLHQANTLDRRNLGDGWKGILESTGARDQKHRGVRAAAHGSPELGLRAGLVRPGQLRAAWPLTRPTGTKVRPSSTWSAWGHTARWAAHTAHLRRGGAGRGGPKGVVESTRQEKRLSPLGGLQGKGAARHPRAGERARQRKTPGTARRESSRPRSWEHSKARSKSPGWWRVPASARAPGTQVTAVWNPAEHRQSSAPLGTLWLLCLLPLRLSILGAPASQCPMPYPPPPPSFLSALSHLSASTSSLLGLHSLQGALSSCLSPLFFREGTSSCASVPHSIRALCFGASAFSGFPSLHSPLPCSFTLLPLYCSPGSPIFSRRTSYLLRPFLSCLRLKLMRSHFLPCLDFYFLAALPASSLVACPFAVGKQELVAGSF